MRQPADDGMGAPDDIAGERPGRGRHRSDPAADSCARSTTASGRGCRRRGVGLPTPLSERIPAPQGPPGLAARVQPPPAPRRHRAATPDHPLDQPVRLEQLALGAGDSARRAIHRPRLRRVLLRAAMEHGERVPEADVDEMLDDLGQCVVIEELLAGAAAHGPLGPLTDLRCPVRIAGPSTTTSCRGVTTVGRSSGPSPRRSSCACPGSGTCRCTTTRSSSAA